jgi:Acyl-coenzyme A:6-aminopenicillanic acid acyl-transferase
MKNPAGLIPHLDVTCSGTPYEMGLAQGRAMRDKIHFGRSQLRQLEAFRMEQPRWMPYPLFLPYAERKVASLFRSDIEAAFPAAAQQLQGIAVGAQTSLNTIYFFNGLEALMASVDGRVLIPALSAACSAIAVRGTRSAIGQPIIARNFDYIPLVQPFFAMREIRPTAGLRSLEFFTAPMAGAIDGVNEAGLAITYNYAFTLDKPSRPAGLVSLAISEALARCRTVAEAAEWIASRPRRGAALLMLSDESGDIASLELAATHSQLRRPSADQNLLYHSNCFFHDEMCALQVPAQAVFTDRAPTPIRGRRVLQSADCRRNRLGELLADNRPLGSDELQHTLSDHGPTGQPSDDTLCMHGTYWTTTASLQWFPRERKVRVAYAPTCQAKYVEFQLN